MTWFNIKILWTNVREIFSINEIVLLLVASVLLFYLFIETVKTFLSACSKYWRVSFSFFFEMRTIFWSHQIGIRKQQGRRKQESRRMKRKRRDIKIIVSMNKWMGKASYKTGTLIRIFQCFYIAYHRSCQILALSLSLCLG